MRLFSTMSVCLSARLPYSRSYEEIFDEILCGHWHHIAMNDFVMVLSRKHTAAHLGE